MGILMKVHDFIFTENLNLQIDFLLDGYLKFQHVILKENVFIGPQAQIYPDSILSPNSVVCPLTSVQEMKVHFFTFPLSA